MTYQYRVRKPKRYDYYSGDRVSFPNGALMPFRVKRAPKDMPIEVGSLFATDGAWNRKYRVISGRVEYISQPIRVMERGYHWRMVEKVPVNVIKLELQYIGEFFSDGRVLWPKRKVKPVKVAIYNFADGTEYSRGPQVHVIPQ